MPLTGTTGMNGGMSATEPLIDHAYRRQALKHKDHGGSYSFKQFPELGWIFDELPEATIVSVSRPDTGDISPLLLSYELELRYKEFKWRLLKTASQVLYLHFALRKRAFVEELKEKQEQVGEWLQSIGIGENLTAMEDVVDPDDEAAPVHSEESFRTRVVPSSAALAIIRPTLGGQQAIAEKAKVAMQNYLNHFLGNLDIVNAPEVCTFLEVSKLSFSREYGPKLKEGYVSVKHLTNLSRMDSTKCCLWNLFDCFSSSWEKVWAVLKPGFLALLENPLDTEILDIIVFEVLPSFNENGKVQTLANPIKESKPLQYSFEVSCGNRSIRFRTSSTSKVNEWVSAIRDAALRPLDGWCHPHRHGSFAPPRGVSYDESKAQWFVDGQAAFGAIASAIESAKSEIFIMGWWICPQLYLTRPFENHPSSRLESLLEAKAKQGVQIYVLLYKEMSIALKINSQFSKKRLQKIHENVKVLRYPDHLSTGVYLWSHHEKLVIVDYQICFIGGLDLCFGRYDTLEHRIGDDPPHLWPGKDYYNPRESEPNSWEDSMKDEVDRKNYPRMPWHDVHCAVWGSPCRDVARHFVQRWNHAKRSKAPNEHAIPLLMPHHHMVLPRYIRTKEIDIDQKGSQDTKDDGGRTSFSEPSPIQDIPLLLPQEVATEFCGNPDYKLHDKNETASLRSNSSRKSFSFSSQKFSGFSDPQTHEFFVESEPENEFNMSNDLGAVSEEDNGDIFCDENVQVGPCCNCVCQVIRSVSHWSAGTSQPEDSIHSAYCSLIENAEHFIYIENQFFISGLQGDVSIQNRVMDALYNRILLAHKENKCFRVIILLPLLPGFQGGVDDAGAATVRAIMHWQYRSISRERTSILHHLSLLLGPKASDYISFYGLRTYGKLRHGGPLATSQIYVHSKVMIVDDRIALIGSSNINDRSLLGSRDSEIGIVIEDTEFIESSMNGPWKAGKFAHSLRCSLWSEHLNLSPQEKHMITDPVAESTYKDLWLATAKANTAIYQDVFGSLPDDRVCSRAALRQHVNQRKAKIANNTIDLGIAPEMIEYRGDGEVRTMDPMERLRLVKGHLVSFPLEFMSNEDLRPTINESEFYTSPQVFH